MLKKCSPQILYFSWGRLKIEGQPRLFKDAKLYPGGAREWIWAETGTLHMPGIQPSDVEELIEHGAKVIVLSIGIHKRLHVCPETIKLLNDKHIPTYILTTEKAIQRYNELAQYEPVGGLIHSTC